jgi:hypothetical protein
MENLYKKFKIFLATGAYPDVIQWRNAGRRNPSGESTGEAFIVATLWRHLSPEAMLRQKERRRFLRSVER